MGLTRLTAMASPQMLPRWLPCWPKCCSSASSTLEATGPSIPASKRHCPSLCDACAQLHSVDRSQNVPNHCPVFAATCQGCHVDPEALQGKAIHSMVSAPCFDMSVLPRLTPTPVHQCAQSAYTACLGLRNGSNQLANRLDPCK